MARLRYKQPITINGKEYSLPENRAVEDWTWNRVKFGSFIFACLAAVGGLLLLGYWLGGSGCYTCTQNKPAATVVATPLVSTEQTAEITAAIESAEKTLRDIEERRAGETAAEMTAATTTIVAPPSPKARRQVRPTTKAEPPPCQCPPEPAKAPTVDQNPPPSTPTLSFAERRRNEMWSALRR